MMRLEQAAHRVDVGVDPRRAVAPPPATPVPARRRCVKSETSARLPTSRRRSRPRATRRRYEVASGSRPAKRRTTRRAVLPVDRIGRSARSRAAMASVTRRAAAHLSRRPIWRQYCIVEVPHRRPSAPIINTGASRWCHCEPCCSWCSSDQHDPHGDIRRAEQHSEYQAENRRRAHHHSFMGRAHRR